MDEIFNSLVNEKDYKDCKEIVVFGACFRGMYVVDLLEKQNIKVTYFCDHDEKKCGQVFYKNIKCITYDELVLLDNVYVIIVTQKNLNAIRDSFNEKNIGNCSAYQITLKDKKEKVNELFEILDDEESKKTMMNVLKYSINGNVELLKEVYNDNQYFGITDFKEFDVGKVYVDCGAYTGDTLEVVMARFNSVAKKYYAFEPGSKQLNALTIRKNRIIAECALEEDVIETINAGVGKKSYYTKFLNDSNSVMGSFTLSHNEVEDDAKDDSDIQVIDLDSFFENKSQKVSCIKMDIEGFELDALEGAKNVIKRDKPYLAICIYHKPSDFYEIPFFIKALVPEYKFAIRHHSLGLTETVLYCWL